MNLHRSTRKLKQPSNDDYVLPKKASHRYGRSMSESNNQPTGNQINGFQFTQCVATKSSHSGGIKGSTTNPIMQVPNIDRSTKPVHSR
ncbi:unnamed protein product, partial [Rotaria sp. Silwood2]